MSILVTGAAGYIGSHAVKRLLETGRNVVGVDHLHRGNPGAVEVIRSFGGDRFHFVKADLRDPGVVAALVDRHDVKELMHFAALAYVGESVEQPLSYWGNNVGGTVTLLEACAGRVERIVFSSTCATYGDVGPESVPIRETLHQNPINPYGRSKLACEQLIRDAVEAWTHSGHPCACTFLRYFNVAGCDPDGKLGEDHRPETHLIPIVLEAAIGKRPSVKVFGTDYPTPDGTAIRDYVHVTDLVEAHIAVLDAMRSTKAGSCLAYNVGIGKGSSVREVIESCRRVTGMQIRAEDAQRRPGDPPELYADPSKIVGELGWKPRYTELDAIVETAWRWMSSNPDGCPRTGR